MCCAGLLLRHRARLLVHHARLLLPHCTRLLIRHRARLLMHHRVRLLVHHSLRHRSYLILLSFELTEYLHFCGGSYKEIASSHILGVPCYRSVFSHNAF